MSEIVVSHGYGAGDDSVWFPYLTEQLAGAGHRVTVPRLPETNAPRLEPWRKTYGEAVAAAGPAEDTVLVGHSIGAVNVLRFLEQHDADAGGVFAGVLLVAASAHEVGYDELAEFFEGGFDWARIRRAARQFRVLQAIDDPVNQPDPTEHVRLFVEGLGATAVVTPTGGHFGATPDDHVEVPEAVRLVTELIGA
ncbi:RBBP9/YdeN family alpha/beta hydrolase [Yinghuangia soli]|uniref:Alpha/beta hydrolase n=1 Tax=Yinghuangia soli TaxID=2908204 RepID=A0AA41TZH0_9ACTN|nr:alpha/beta hydrolase [Yinghuangia soli]MCF2528808.1 alpha/beta hydrolase [Yinghuangia soli]